MKYLCGDRVFGNIYNLDVIGDHICEIHSQSAFVEKNVVSFIAFGGLDLYKMIFKWAYQHKVALLQFVSLVLDGIGGVSADKIQKLVHIVGVNGKGGAVFGRGYIVLEV